MKKIVKCLALLTLIISTAIYAMTLADAKKAGYLGEQSDGYIGISSTSIPSALQTDVSDLKNTINDQRRKEYQLIASNNQTSVAEVQKVAGKTLIAQAKPGEYVQTSQGVWVKK